MTYGAYDHTFTVPVGFLMSSSVDYSYFTFDISFYTEPSFIVLNSAAFLNKTLSLITPVASNVLSSLTLALVTMTSSDFSYDPLYLPN